MPPKKNDISYFGLCNEIKNKQFRPIYVLQGEEPYYIDKLSDLIVENALTEDERDFNLTIVYGYINIASYRFRAIDTAAIEFSNH